MQCNPWFNARSPHHDLWLTNSWADSRMTILFSSSLKNWWMLSLTEKRTKRRLEIIARNPYHVFLQNWRECIDSSTFQRPTDLVFQKTKYEVCCFYFFSLHKTIFGREAGAFIRKINVWTILFLALQKCCNVLQNCRVFRLQFLKDLLYHNVLFRVS